MSFLLVKGNEVVCSEDGMLLPEVQTVYNNDKTGKGKTYFQEVITAIYYLYKPRGPFWNKPFTERVDLVESDFIKGKWNDLIRRDGVKEFVDKYVELSQTVTEQMEESLKTDIHDLLKELNNVPSVVSRKIKQEAEVLCDDNVLHKVKVEADVMIPNFEGKKTLWDLSLTFSKVFKDIQQNLKVEAEERERDDLARRMFDGTRK
jgi:hypothetical protein